MNIEQMQEIAAAAPFEGANDRRVQSRILAALTEIEHNFDAAQIDALMGEQTADETPAAARRRLYAALATYQATIAPPDTMTRRQAQNYLDLTEGQWRYVVHRLQELRPIGHDADGGMLFARADLDTWKSGQDKKKAAPARGVGRPRKTV